MHKNNKFKETPLSLKLCCHRPPRSTGVEQIENPETEIEKKRTRKEKEKENEKGTKEKNKEKATSEKMAGSRSTLGRSLTLNR